MNFSETDSVFASLSGLLGDSFADNKPEEPETDEPGGLSLGGLYDNSDGGGNKYDIIDDLITFEGTSNDFNKTAYVVCEKPGFRANGFFMEMSQSHKAKLLCLENAKVEEIVDPLCFIVDVTTSMITNQQKKILNYLNKHAFGRQIPVFLIGEPEDLENTRKLRFPRNISIIEFERPLDMKECLIKIEKILNHEDDTEKRKHILVVDDSITFLRLVKKTLEKEYDITMSTSAFNCIEILSNLPDLPDLIIIDYMMPACDGMTLCKMIKEDKRTKDIPIIFYSGNSNVDEIIELMPLIDGYMLKSEPVSSLDQYLFNFFEQKEQDRKAELARKARLKKTQR